MINSLNFAYCIQKSSNIGSTKFYNICDQSQNVVPWGSLDWFAFLIPTTMMATVVGIGVWALGSIAYEAYQMNKAYKKFKKSIKITNHEVTKDKR